MIWSNFMPKQELLVYCWRIFPQNNIFGTPCPQPVRKYTAWDKTDLGKALGSPDYSPLNYFSALSSRNTFNLSLSKFTRFWVCCPIFC